MPTLRLFNPQNDLALAAGLRAYTPPGPAAAFAAAGALLPAWWSAEDDIIAVSAGLAGDAQWLRREYGLSVETTGGENADALDPWGWSVNAAAILASHGARHELLPDIESLDTLRRLSHRRTAMTLRRALGVDEGTEITCTDDAREYLRRNNGQVFAKSPWSCSGRGVVPLMSMPPDKATEIIAGIIRRQGSAMLECATSPGTDFAALFECRDGKARFTGWSVFESSTAGAYSGNLVASQATLRTLLAERTDIQELDSTITILVKALDNTVAPYYTGPAGIDMLIGADGTINPCIELNLRRTMGFVARDVHARLGVEGRLVMTAGRDAIKLCRPRGRFCIGVDISRANA